MRITLVSSVMVPMTNGVATFVNNLAHGLARDGHEVAIITSSFIGHPHKNQISKNLTVYSVSSERFPYYPDQMHDLKNEKPPFKHGVWLSFHPKTEVFRILDEFKPDIIHLMTPEMLSLAAKKYAKIHKIPLVYTNHNYPETMTSWINLPRPVKKTVEKIIWKYFRSFALAADFVTTPTEQVMDDLLKTPGRKISAPIAVISNGVDLSNFAQDASTKNKQNRNAQNAYSQNASANSKQKRSQSNRPGLLASAKNNQKRDELKFAVRKKYHIPENAKMVLYVGRVDPEKNIEKVIRAFALTCEKIPEAFLVIVGDGLDRTRLEKLTRTLKIESSVRFLGKILMPELANVYSSGDIFASASEMETEGIVFIEAAAAGLPLVGVNKGGVSEICVNDRSGILCQPGNKKEMILEFSLAIEKLLADEKFARRMSAGALEVAKSRDSKETLRRFENIYSHLASKAQS